MFLLLNLSLILFLHVYHLRNIFILQLFFLFNCKFYYYIIEPPLPRFEFNLIPDKFSEEIFPCNGFWGVY
jgi:hypothetical protein